jgi:hypothetical protein
MRLQDLRNAQKIPSTRRAHGCRAGLSYNEYEAYIVESGGAFSWKGLTRCESSWCCPYCSPFQARTTAERVQDTLHTLFRDGFVVNFVTLTCHHSKSHSLKWLLEHMRIARRHLFASRSFREITKLHGGLGNFRSWEVTHGQNGWHPHTHEFLPFRDKVPGLREWYTTAWARSCEYAGLYASKSHGTLCCEVHTDKLGAVAYYATGWGAATESAGMPFKTARAGNRTVWDLLKAAVMGSDEAATLWTEYATTTAGQKRMSWSGKLKGMIAPPRDKQQGQLDFGAEVLDITLGKGAWDHAVRTHQDIEILKCLAEGKIDLARELCDAVRGEYDRSLGTWYSRWNPNTGEYDRHDL